MYFSILFFLVLDFFSWQIVFIHEWEKFITIREWPISAFRKQYRIFIIINYSQIWTQQLIYLTCLIMKVMRYSNHQMIILIIKKFSVLLYQSCRLKEIKHIKGFMKIFFRWIIKQCTDDSINLIPVILHLNYWRHPP